MKAVVTAWEVKDYGVPAMHTRREEPDGSITFEGIYEVTMKFDVIGNVDAAFEFLNGVKKGQRIESINFREIKSKGTKSGKKTTARKYVFE